MESHTTCPRPKSSRGTGSSWLFLDLTAGRGQSAREGRSSRTTVSQRETVMTVFLHVKRREHIFLAAILKVLSSDDNCLGQRSFRTLAFLLPPLHWAALWWGNRKSWNQTGHLVSTAGSSGGEMPGEVGRFD